MVFKINLVTEKLPLLFWSGFFIIFVTVITINFRNMHNNSYKEDYVSSIPEMTPDDFSASTFGVDIRGIEFIPYPIEWFFDESLNVYEQRFLAFVRFKENRRKKLGCILTNSQLSIVMKVSEKRIQNIISDLKTRGYIDVEYDGYRSIFTNLRPKT